MFYCRLRSAVVEYEKLSSEKNIWKGKWVRIRN